MKQKCQDPCPGSCGVNAYCNVYNHNPICSCIDGYTGDPFTSCYIKPTSRKYFCSVKIVDHRIRCIKALIIYFNHLIHSS